MILKKMKRVALFLFSAASVAVLGDALLTYHTHAGAPRPAQATVVLPRDGEQGAPRARLDQHGDPLPAGALARLGSMRLRHGSTIAAFAFSTNGLLASGGHDGVVHVWDIATGKEMLRVDGIPMNSQTAGRGMATDVALSPDGKRLAIAWINAPPALWDVQGARKMTILGGKHCRARRIRFSDDGKYISFERALPNGRIETHLANADNGTEMHRALVRKVLFVPKSQWLIETVEEMPTSTTSGRTFRVVRNLDGGKEICRLNGNVANEDVAEVSRDGKVFVGCAEDGAICTWDVATGKERARIPAEKELAWLVSSPDGNCVVAVGKDRASLRCFDAPTAKERWSAKVNADWDKVSGVVFLPGGARVLSVHEYGRMRLWDIATGKEVTRKQPHTSIRTFAVSPDGATIVTGAANPEDTTIGLWDAQTLEPKLPASGHAKQVNATAFSPDGRHVATAAAEEAIRVWEPRTGAPIRTISAPWTAALEFDPSGKVLITGDQTSGKARLWDVSSGRQIREIDAHPKGPCRLVLSPDGARLYTTGSDNKVRCWETATGKPVREFSDNMSWILRLAVSPSGNTVVTVHGDDKLCFWNTASGTKVRELLALAGQIGGIAFSPDRTVLAWVDGTAGIRCTDVTNGLELRRLPGPMDPHGVLAFSRDGKALVQSSLHGLPELHIWEVSTGQIRHTLLPHDGPVGTATFSRDGALLLTAGSDGSALIWDYHGRHTNSRPQRKAELDQLTRWRKQLAIADAPAGYQAMQSLRDHGSQAVPILAELFAVRNFDAAQVQSWLKALDSEVFQTRERAMRELTSLGAAITPELREAVKHAESLEGRRRIEHVLGNLEHSRLLQERAVEVLEMIGNPQAAKVLKTLAAGRSEQALTHDAAAALQRLAGGLSPVLQAPLK